MFVSVSSITYGGEKITDRGTKDRLESAIRSRGRFEVSDSNLNEASSESPQRSCTIEYQAGDGVQKRRTLERGRTFDFGNDIQSIKFPERITDLKAFEHIFKYMDTSDRFKVQRSDFGVRSGGNHIYSITLEYNLPDNQSRQHDMRENGVFIFAQGSHRYEPRPPTPDSCECPCLSCKLNHQTDEERKATKDKREHEEKERQQELERLKNAIEEARRLANEAMTKSQDAQQQAENLKEALKNLRRLADQASNEAENASKAAQEAKQDSKQTQAELKETRRELEGLKAQLQELLDQYGDVRLPKTPAVVKVFFFGSQLLAVVILVTFAVKQVRRE